MNLFVTSVSSNTALQTVTANKQQGRSLIMHELQVCSQGYLEKKNKTKHCTVKRT